MVNKERCGRRGEKDWGKIRKRKIKNRKKERKRPMEGERGKEENRYYMKLKERKTQRKAWQVP